MCVLLEAQRRALLLSSLSLGSAPTFRGHRRIWERPRLLSSASLMPCLTRAVSLRGSIRSRLCQVGTTRSPLNPPNPREGSPLLYVLGVRKGSHPIKHSFWDTCALPQPVTPPNLTEAPEPWIFWGFTIHPLGVPAKPGGSPSILSLTLFQQSLGVLQHRLAFPCHCC